MFDLINFLTFNSLQNKIILDFFNKNLQLFGNKENTLSLGDFTLIIFTFLTVYIICFLLLKYFFGKKSSFLLILLSTNYLTILLIGFSRIILIMLFLIIFGTMGNLLLTSLIVGSIGFVIAKKIDFINLFSNSNTDSKVIDIQKLTLQTIVFRTILILISLYLTLLTSTVLHHFVYAITSSWGTLPN